MPQFPKRNQNDSPATHNSLCLSSALVVLMVGRAVFVVVFVKGVWFGLVTVFSSSLALVKARGLIHSFTHIGSVCVVVWRNFSSMFFA